MTKLQLLHRALNERLMAAVEQIMEMVGGTVLEYEEETIRVRKENEVLRRRLRWMEGANPADWPGPSEPVTLSTPDESNPALHEECAVSFGYDQESELFVIKTEPADITDDPSLINPESSLTALPPGTDPGSANAIADSKIDCGLTDSVNWDSTTSYMAPLDSDPTSPTDIRRWRGGSKRQKSSFACPECGKMFGREQRLMFHMRAHSTERPYSQGANPRRKTCFSGDNKRKGKVRSLTQPSKSKIEDQDPDGLSAAESDHTNNDKDAKNSTVKPVPNKRRGGRTKMSRCTQCSRVFNRPCRLAVHMKTHAKRKPLTNLPNKEPSGRDEKREMQSRPVGGVVVTSARPKERKLADGLRSTLDKGVTGALPNLSVLQVYTDFASTAAPLVTTIGMSSEISLVDSAFGKVQAGSVLSYQQPGATTRNITRHQDAPPPPSLPLDGYSLDSSVCLIAHSKQGLLHMTSLAVTLETAHIIEQATRDQNTSLDWHSIRNPRVISSRFREVCHVEGQSTAEHLASRIYKGTHRKTFMKRGLEIESAAVEEYCLLREVNFYSCGVLIHPDAPWLGASPDGIVYDPTEHQPFGLVEIKCPNVKSFVDCPCLKLQNGRPELKQQHGYYWQVQGQMLISGLDWCDFVVYAQNDMMIQRIYKDSSIFKTIREKADYFFFYFYLPRSLEM